MRARLVHQCVIHRASHALAARGSIVAVLAAIDEVLRRAGGVATRSRLLTVVTRGQLDHEVRSGQLVSPFPRAMCRPWDAHQPAILRRAALTSVGPPATLSHTSALQMWGLPSPAIIESMHVTVPAARCPRSRPGLRVHRVARFPGVVKRDALITTTVAEALVASWPLLIIDERRSALIAASRQRLVTPAQIREAAAHCPRLADRAALHELVDLLASGCESELEIWGHQRVFAVPGLSHGVRQRVVRAAGRVYRLDLAYEAERVAVEMDGRTHSGDDARERDTRRDAALAAVGWLTVRFTHLRLTPNPQDCRRELLAILAGRCPR